MERIDGKALAAKVKAEVAAEVEALRAQGVAPKLTVILVGEDFMQITTDPNSLHDVREALEAKGCLLYTSRCV